MAAKGKRPVTPANRPEYKIGPFQGGPRRLDLVEHGGDGKGNSGVAVSGRATQTLCDEQIGE
ncbi:hypothetical protein BH10PLA2_BH10PLA2_15900 [soil metagenome]